MNRVVEMERKVTKFGNSLGITMTDALKQIGLEQGDTVSIDVNQSSGEITIKKANKVTLPEGISDEFMQSLADVINEYDQTLRNLKDR
ncbi:AbrB family transcriptional regulator [Paenibacillus thiaminolyticus]|uniref:AbrB family transcriptional regulator n=1 Tax=Paenibacillus thiaminolyticus TaxID=49283 RepID=A0AAP9DVZ2_PANTH|nr:AbrB family transcriptional regulator [Paenibacillus]MCY9538990.1 AbrB family transcriptional regulator [Paenibacillus thiaminolyticus]MCY9604224.1 AbrB family transcriptional regulator [Paenibacillus thiaminolyticus]MCY9608101.1 AbrB family transcriptional regulator [Paenibacillus thiaminolyticus]MCY9612940.1 AbrB family transcriptional regulator [Paenibacillus thiaminolyticus]MCY9622006.1 AbrB family transcriptional regulator [Paenibacillus thiaminolyticus]